MGRGLSRVSLCFSVRTKGKGQRKRSDTKGQTRRGFYRLWPSRKCRPPVGRGGHRDPGGGRVGFSQSWIVLCVASVRVPVHLCPIIKL